MISEFYNKLTMNNYFDAQGVGLFFSKALKFYYQHKNESKVCFLQHPPPPRPPVCDVGFLSPLPGLKFPAMKCEGTPGFDIRKVCRVDVECSPAPHLPGSGPTLRGGLGTQ